MGRSDARQVIEQHEPEPGRIYVGDCIDAMRRWPDASFDACITDPPYNMSRKRGLTWAFSSHVTMQESWDRFSRDGYFEFTRAWLGEVARLVKPNGNILVFGSFHNIYVIGFVLQSVIAFWFHVRFDANPATLGEIFFGANLLAGISALAAAAIARRVGLINTMVFTHVPSNVLLILLPLMPTLPLAVAVFLVRCAISQMDVPARQSYTAAVVSSDERAAAAGVTGVARTTGAALSPVLAGLLLGSPALTGAPFIVAGVLKLLYDGLLYRLFRGVTPPEEGSPRPAREGNSG